MLSSEIAMNYLTRQLTPRLLRFVATFPVVVISGARQVGKSTLLAHALGEPWGSVVLDPAIDVEGARRDPDLFLENRKAPLVLDEIQYAPELVGAIKRRVDRDRKPGQYVLTGSQQWGVLKSLSESLAGRAVLIELEGFSVAEATGLGDRPPWFRHWLSTPGHAFPSLVELVPSTMSLYERIWRGHLPEALSLPLDVIPDFHASYRRTYIERDVRLLANVSDAQVFGRFLGLAGALTAQEVNGSQFGRELGVTPQTSRRWLDILESTFQWYEVPPWSGNVVKRVTGRSKGYIADTGLTCLSLSIPTPEAIGAHPLRGALFESLVAGEIRKQIGLLSPRPNLWHWRSHGGAEVDLIAEWNGVLFPIEIKATSHPGRRDTSGLVAFREAHARYEVAAGMVICPTDSCYPLDQSNWAIPWNLVSRG
jgi:hypothetical protein